MSLSALALLALASASTTPVAAVPAAVTIVVDYSVDTQDPASGVYDDLAANAGKAIWLDLTVVPAQDETHSGYHLATVGGSEDDADLLCGRDQYGVVDNYGTDWRLAVDHLDNVHATLTVHVGDRAAYPFQDLACGLEGYTEPSPVGQALTKLHLRGWFVVQAADIPTAAEYVLTPIRPSSGDLARPDPVAPGAE